MIGAPNRHRWLLCWGASILFHVGILTFGAILLIKAVRFQVEAGKTSTETDLVIEPSPVPAIRPPTIAPPTPAPPLPQERPIPAPPSIISIATTGLEHISAPTTSPVTPAKPQPPEPQRKSKAVAPHETSSASKGAVDAQPDELHNEPPTYPEESRADREQGVVILRVEVTVEGEPATVSILKSSGFFRLDQAARHAVQHWKFHPALVGGIPVASNADVPVHFQLQ